MGGFFPWWFTTLGQVKLGCIEYWAKELIVLAPLQKLIKAFLTSILTL